MSAMDRSRLVKKSVKSRRLFIIVAVLLVDTNSNDSRVSVPFHFSEQAYNLNYNLYEQMYYASGSSDDSSRGGVLAGGDSFNHGHSSSSSNLPDLHEKHLWLYDESITKCLNPYGGFSLCGDVNLFKAHVIDIDANNPSKYTLILESAIPDTYISDAAPSSSSPSSSGGSSKKCLGRRISNAASDSDVLETSIHDCEPLNSNSYKNIGVKWTFEWYGNSDNNNSGSSSGGSDWGLLRASGSEVSGDMCASRGGGAENSTFPRHSLSLDNKFAYLQTCEQGEAIRFIPIIYTHLRHIESLLDPNPNTNNYDDDELEPPSSSETPPALVEEGVWECPRTWLPFPRNLDQHMRHNYSRQVLMGGGLFSRTIFGFTFNVYTVVWYVEREMAKKSPLLMKFIGKSAASLQQSDAFYEAMTEEDNGYARSILMKLAMPLKKEIVIQGLLEEMHLQPENARVLYDVAMRYNSTECEKGTEILVSWFPPVVNNNNNNNNRGVALKKRGSQRDTTDDYVEIRIGGELLATVRKGGLGKDFFKQYVSDDPVTPEGRKGFATGFPLLLAQDVIQSSRYRGPRGASPSGHEARAPSAQRREGASDSPFSFNREIRMLVSCIKTRVFSEYILQRHLWNILTNKNYEPSKKFLQITNSLFNAYRPESVEEILYSTFIVCYCILLMIMSMPMPLRRSVKKTVKKTVRKIKEITRNLSNSALASLRLGHLDDTRSSVIIHRDSNWKCNANGSSGYAVSFDDKDDEDDAKFADFWK